MMSPYTHDPEHAPEKDSFLINELDRGLKMMPYAMNKYYL